MSLINLEALRAATVHSTPFPYLIVPGFLRKEARADIMRDFPDIQRPGSFPCSTLSFGPNFAALMDEIQSEEMATVTAEKLQIELGSRPTMVTVRGRCRAGDGKIHCDSHGKLATALIYMNSEWEADGGRLRLLNGAHDINDYFAEVPPDQGTLLLFRCTENAWHGHRSFKGERRTVQLNWVESESYRQRELHRHAWSAMVKKIGAFFRSRIN